MLNSPSRWHRWSSNELNMSTLPASSPTAPLVLTLKLDSQSFDLFNKLRQQHFPAEKNFLPAHITLFHALPGEQEADIQQLLQRLCAQTPALPLTFPKLRLLGQGVAAEVDCPGLLELRQQLAQRWQAWLNRQDRQKYQPHLTIQNKTTPAAAQQLYHHLGAEWHPIEGRAEGLLLWHYRGGPWQLAGEFGFGKPALTRHPSQRRDEQAQSG